MMDKAMSLKRGLITALSFVAMMALGGPVCRADGEGSATVIPGRAPVREWSTQQVIYTVGSSGIARGGGIKVQFPKSWHVTRFPLNLDPTEDYHISATTCRPGAEIVLSVAHVGIDGRTDTRDWTVKLTVEGQSLAPGDVITYTFGDQSGGGRGVRTGEKAEVENVCIASDSDGDGSYVELGDLPQIETVAGPASDLTVIAPSIVARGEPFELAVIAQDG